MLVVWQYRNAFSSASQDVQTPGQLDALLRVLDQRAAADGYPHAVLLSADADRIRVKSSPASAGAAAGQGPQPELTLVVGAPDAPVLWWDSLPAARQISVGSRQVPQPEPQDFFGYYSGGQERYAPESSLVSREDSRNAARLFLTSGGHRPVIITWRTPSLAPSPSVGRVVLARSEPEVEHLAPEAKRPRPEAGGTGRYPHAHTHALSAAPAAPARSVARAGGYDWRPWPLTS